MSGSSCSSRVSALTRWFRGSCDGERSGFLAIAGCVYAYAHRESIDVASYEKEFQQNTLDNNLVERLLKNGIDGHTFVSALAVKEYLTDRIVDCEAKAQGAISAMLADDGTPESVRRWLGALPYLISGSTWWTQQVRIHYCRGKYPHVLFSPDWAIQHRRERCAA